MIKHNKSICDACNSSIKSTKAMTEEEWGTMEKGQLTLCIACKIPTQLEELELAKEHLDPSYYWSRKNELELSLCKDCLKVIRNYSDEKN